MGKYHRENVYEYAKEWAYGRNPKYYNYDPIGGDCTNFVSQCIFAGCGQMNYRRNNGWYYINGNDKSPSWTGVKFLYDFLISNKGPGPYGKVAAIQELEIGDVIQLSFDGTVFSHSLIVVKNGTNTSNTLIAAHTFDTFGKRVSDYLYQQYRCIHLF
ncbi:MAG: amidase domain-containing protein [Clostridia bacterium]|nr:amidase domain-containing protein [Clostridia bacterium]